MAKPITGMEQTYDIVGGREDLADVIYNITPAETPFMANAGRGKAKAVLFEWQTDILQSPDTSNRQVEGFEATFESADQPTRVANVTQISSKALVFAETVDAVDKAGRESDTAYHTAKKSKELKRDMETLLIGVNAAADIQDEDEARVTASILAWIRTNTNFNTSDGANPGAPNPTPATARTDGTQRAFTEAQVKDVVAQMWASGADINGSSLLVNAGLKQKFSTFEGIATMTKNLDEGQATIVGAADIYVSDFGTFTVVPNRYMRTRDAIFVDWEHVEVAYLRPFKRDDLAKTGDSHKKLLVVEYGLKVKNEAALGIVADLDAAL